jgi:hypothetical protein
VDLSNASWEATTRLCRVSVLLWAEIVEAKLRQLERTVDAKFNPNQPRVPAGNPDGGQWTNGGSGADGETETTLSSIIAVARRIASSGSPLDYQRCLDLCYPLLERLSHPASDRNTWDFHKCMNECLNRNL